MLILDCSNGILTLKLFLSPHPQKSHSEGLQGKSYVPLSGCNIPSSTTTAQISSVTGREVVQKMSSLMAVWSHRLSFLLKWLITVPGITVYKATSVLLLKAIIRNKNLLIRGHYHMHVQRDSALSYSFALRPAFWDGTFRIEKAISIYPCIHLTRIWPLHILQNLETNSFISMQLFTRQAYIPFLASLLALLHT